MLWPLELPPNDAKPLVELLPANPANPPDVGVVDVAELPKTFPDAGAADAVELPKTFPV